MGHVAQEAADLSIELGFGVVLMLNRPSARPGKLATLRCIDPEDPRPAFEDLEHAIDGRGIAPYRRAPDAEEQPIEALELQLAETLHILGTDQLVESPLDRPHGSRAVPVAEAPGDLLVGSPVGFTLAGGDAPGAACAFWTAHQSSSSRGSRPMPCIRSRVTATYLGSSSSP